VGAGAGIVRKVRRDQGEVTCARLLCAATVSGYPEASRGVREAALPLRPVRVRQEKAVFGGSWCWLHRAQHSAAAQVALDGVGR